MNDQQPEQPQEKSSAQRSGRPALVLALALALLAIAGTAAQWLGLPGRRAAERNRVEELAKVQHRLNAMEDRLQRQRDELVRLTQKI